MAESAPTSQGRALSVRLFNRLSEPVIRTVFVAVCLLSLFALDRLWPVGALSLAALFFLIGAPHGGVEIKEGRVHPPGLRFSGLYLLIGLGIASIWWAAPGVSLVLFLALSIHHFGRADASLKTIGWAVVLGPFAVWPEQTLAIFGAIGGFEVGSLPPDLRLFLSAVGLAAITVLMAEATLRGRGLDRAAILSLALLLLSPVLSVATYFLLLHAAPDYRRAARQLYWDRVAIGKLYAPTGLPAIVGGVGLIALFIGGWVDAVWLGAAGAGVAIPHLLYALWKGWVR